MQRRVCSMIHDPRSPIQTPCIGTFKKKQSILILCFIVALSLSSLPGIGSSDVNAVNGVRWAVGKSQSSDTIQFVIHVSVDGLRSDAVPRLGPGNLPHFYRMGIEGIFTDNARTDYDFTNTLPNHVCQLTGRNVTGHDGHNVTFNSDNGSTLEATHGSYVAGVFDVAHDHGLRTGMYASKSKFDFLERSWNEVNGAPDTIDIDNGRDKIDIYVNNPNTTTLVETFLTDMTAAPYQYCFIQLTDPDTEGHASGWSSMPYFQSLMKIDGLLGQIFDLIENSPAFSNRTGVIVTSDHGGIGTSHGDATDPNNYTVPFYVWGPGIPAGTGLYWLNQVTRQDPGTGRPNNEIQHQPVRNGDVANLALDLLGLDSIPGSVINASHDLEITLPGGSGDLPAVSITSPLDGAVFETPDTMMIEAMASTSNGSIINVEFFVNWDKLGEDATSPYSFTWNEIPTGLYALTVRAMRDDSVASTASIDVEVTTTASVATRENDVFPFPLIYPNPFSGSTRIEFSLSRSELVEMSVYDLLGRRVMTVFRGCRESGNHQTFLNAHGMAPGLYFYRLRIGDSIKTGKLMIIR